MIRNFNLPKIFGLINFFCNSLTQTSSTVYGLRLDLVLDNITNKHKVSQSPVIKEHIRLAYLNYEVKIDFKKMKKILCKILKLKIFKFLKFNFNKNLNKILLLS